MLLECGAVVSVLDDERKKPLHEKEKISRVYGNYWSTALISMCATKMTGLAVGVSVGKSFLPCTYCREKVLIQRT